MSGPVGTTVTIAGTNFNTVPANNIVYFGSVKAVITNATITALTVTVPIGITYQPITVTTNGLTAYSAEPFDVTFGGRDSAFNPNSFATIVDFTTDNPPLGIHIADIDGDGKPDIALSYYNNYYTTKTIAVLRNIGTNKINFASKIELTLPFYKILFTVNDFDGDGEPDIIAENGGLSIYRYK